MIRKGGAGVSKNHANNKPKRDVLNQTPSHFGAPSSSTARHAERPYTN